MPEQTQPVDQSEPSRCTLGDDGITMFTFDLLPGTTRRKIYDYCIPQRFEFVGPRDARNGKWSDHPLSNLIRALPRQMSQEINTHIYTSCRFEFIASSGARRRKNYTDGCEVAREFFRQIGPNQFRLIREFYCYFNWKKRFENVDEFFGMLQDFAACPPAREIKNIHLQVEPAQEIKRSIRRTGSTPVCFSLLGFPGVYITILVLGAPVTPELSTSDVNGWIQQHYDPGQPRGFLELPPEVRLIVYQNLVLHRYVIPTRGPRAHIMSTIAPMHCLNKFTRAEYLGELSKTCCLDFLLASSPYICRRFPHQNQAPRAALFLRQMGSNVSSIKHFKITLAIFTLGDRTYAPSILLIVDALNHHGRLEILAVNEASPNSVIDCRDLAFVSVTFRADTGTTTKLTIEVLHPKSIFRDSSPSQVPTILGPSMKGVPTMVDRYGRVHEL